jgi:tRNA U38,U39,U40 pseudouridine synthase TruA
MGEMRVMTVKDGDKKTTWNPGLSDEVDAAKREFEYLVGEKKYSAFAVKKDGEQGRRIDKFDPSIGAMILVPPIAGG